MPSTYTTNTGIEKIADGEQSGLWGQTTNLNFDIVDRALNGSTTVALSGTTHTLTTSDGVLSDGQFSVLVFGGSPGGANTVTISPNTAQKLYWARNTTSENVILSQGSGTNVTIPPGATKAVYSDGAGAAAAVVDLTAVFVGNVTGNVTGDVTGDVTGNVTGNADTATALQSARTIGGVSFDGTANIDLPGVNQTGNQNTTGSAAEATVLATARTLTVGETGKTFDGSADVAWTLAEIGADNRANHTGTQPANTITGLGELATRDRATVAQIRSLDADAAPTAERIAEAAALITPSGAADWAPDWEDFISANWVLTGNRTLQNPTNAIPGTTRVVRAAGDSGTGRTISFGSNYKGDRSSGPVTDDAPILYTLFAATPTEIWVSSMEADP